MWLSHKQLLSQVEYRQPSNIVIRYPTLLCCLIGSLASLAGFSQCWICCGFITKLGLRKGRQDHVEDSVRVLCVPTCGRLWAWFLLILLPFSRVWWILFSITWISSLVTLTTFLLPPNQPRSNYVIFKLFSNEHKGHQLITWVSKCVFVLQDISFWVLFSRARSRGFVAWPTLAEYCQLLRWIHLGMHKLQHSSQICSRTHPASGKQKGPARIAWTA